MFQDKESHLDSEVFFLGGVLDLTVISIKMSVDSANVVITGRFFF